MRKIHNKDDFHCDPWSGSFHAPIPAGFRNISLTIFGKKQPQTETERRINSGNIVDRNQSKDYIGDKYIECFYKLKDLIKDEDIEKITDRDIIDWVKIYFDYLSKWEKPSKIIKSTKNASLGLFYTIRKQLGEKIRKKDFLKNYDITEKHLNKVLQFLSWILIEFRKKPMETDIGLNNQLSEEEDDIEVYYDRLYARWERLYQLLKLKKQFNRQKRLYGWCRKDKILAKQPKNVSEENHFSGFMSCIFFLKFIRECEDAHYDYLLKNGTFYKRGAFFIDFDISNFFNPIDFFYRFQRFEEQEVLQKIVEGLFVELIEKLEEYIYENDEDVDVYKKSREICIQKLPLNFIQVIKESGFTPPIRV